MTLIIFIVLLLEIITFLILKVLYHKCAGKKLVFMEGNPRRVP